MVALAAAAVLTVMARVDAALAPVEDAVLRTALHSAFQALVTDPDPHEVITLDEDGNAVPPPPPVTEDGEVLVSRDETQDSIDPHTGTLTPEAIDRRAQLEAERAANAAGAEGKRGEIAEDQAELDRDNADLAEIEAEDERDAAEAAALEAPAKPPGELAKAEGDAV